MHPLLGHLAVAGTDLEVCGVNVAIQDRSDIFR